MKITKNLLGFALIFLAISGCDKKKETYVEVVCKKDLDANRCINDKSYFLEKRLNSWKPSFFSERVLNDIKITNEYTGKWIGNINKDKEIVNISKIKDLYLSDFNYYNLSKNDLKKAERVVKHIYEVNASFEFDTEQSELTIYDKDFKNDLYQSMIKLNRFGLNSKELDILEFCTSWIFKKIISCVGKVRVTGELFETKFKWSSSSKEPVITFNYYLDSFLLEKQSEKQIKLSLRKEYEKKLIEEFDKHHMSKKE